MSHGNLTNEIGRRYDRLTVLERVANLKTKQARWLCKCDCGAETIVFGACLRTGHTKSCGCLAKEKTSGRRFINRAGKKYGKLTAIKRVGTKYGEAAWLCRCDCGREAIIRASNLQKGSTKSCGCLARLPTGEAAFNLLYGKMKRSANRKGHRYHSWELTKEQIRGLVKLPCYYCGSPPLQKAGDKNNNGYFFYNGLDRVNNDKGYIQDNVVPCCKYCNIAKNTRGIDEFKKWTIQLYEHFVQYSKAAEIERAAEIAKAAEEMKTGSQCL